MTDPDLLADEIDGRLHAAVVRKGVLDDLYVDPPENPAPWAAVYLGKVVKIDPRLDAAFVDLGGGLTGFLPAKHVHPATSKSTGIAGRLRAGQILPVEVKAEAKRNAPYENDKLPRLTARLSTPVDVDIPEGGAPRLLCAGPNAVERALCDYGVSGFSHLHAGNKAILDGIIALHPVLAGSKRLRLFKPEKSLRRLFDVYDLYSALESLSSPVVPLSSGGSLIIEQTAALTVIDVNQGAGQGIAATNDEAAREVARQVRLRNLSGVILVDFISMDKKPDRARLLDTLKKACADDKAGAEIHGLTRLGIVEMTRQRRTATRDEVINP